MGALDLGLLPTLILVQGEISKQHAEDCNLFSSTSHDGIQI